MPDQIVAPAPWTLTGQAVAFLAAPATARLLVNYQTSPVGPYLEHALATLTLRGPHVFQMSVTLEASKRGGREIWGFPKTLENLSWQQRGSRIVFQRENRTFRVRAFGPQFRFALPFWTVQQLNSRAVRVPGNIKARAQLAFRGQQLALFLPRFEMTIDPPSAL